MSKREYGVVVEGAFGIAGVVIGAVLVYFLKPQEVPGCVPNEWRQCPCEKRPLMGWQKCNSGGKAYGECEKCASPVTVTDSDAGVVDAGGTPENADAGLALADAGAPTSICGRPRLC